MRKNRKHVMMDYLEKERQNPLSKDIRVNNARQNRKRKWIELAPPGVEANLGAPSNTCRPEQECPISILCEPGTTKSNGHHDQIPGSEGGGSVPHTNESKQQRKISRAIGRRVDKDKSRNLPLVPGISGRFRNYSYLGTAVGEVPFEINRIGSELNPFDTWPAFSNPSINVSQLKWSCKSGTHGKRI